MKYPFKQKKNNGLLIREFSEDVDSSELVWHRDRKDRFVRVVDGRGWKLQLENKLPKNLVKDRIYFIPKNTYHRVCKGRGNLVVEIRETNSMKITKRQLRRIIQEMHTLEKPAASVPVPEDYQAVRDLLASQPSMVDIGITMIMDTAGTRCQRSSIQAIVDHLQSMLDGRPGST
jgi:hypothetical protein